MRRKRMRLVSLILSAVCLLGCAVQPAPVSDSSESNTKVSAYAASQAEQNEEERTVAESLLPQTEDGGDTSESSVAPERAGAENTDKAAKKQPVPAETAPPLHRKSRQYPRLHRRINLLPHPHRHLHRNRQRNRGATWRLSPNLPLRLSLPPAGTSTLLRRLSGRVTSMQERSAA